jgi:hypothetical protein
MTAIRSERLGADGVGANKSGPEEYAPKYVKAGTSGDLDQAANAFEGQIREFVRRDVAHLRKPRPATELAPAPDGKPVTENLNALIKRVAGSSMEEIDRVILELQAVRDLLRNEGERVTREISSYASLSHAATTSMKVIADSITQWRSGPTNFPREIS